MHIHNFLSQLCIHKTSNSGGVDAVIISHADIQHMGALPVIFGKLGLGGVPVVCTQPVFKFGQLLLYDFCLNKEMEGVSPDDDKKAAGTSASASSGGGISAVGSATPTAEAPGDAGVTSVPGEDSGAVAAAAAASKKNLPKLFDLDDVDLALSRVFPLRYSQTITLTEVTGYQRNVTLCAYPSGRTIGGSIWRIRSGATDVLYVMDVNLKKDFMVLDGVALDLLPSTPALMIVDGASSTNTGKGIGANVAGGGAVAKGKKGSKGKGASVEVDNFKKCILESLRNDQGNVLIPCESVGRTLELIQLLGKHWEEEKMGMDHLIFLSHMGHSIIEFARSHLEWMSDSLSKGFYNGKLNPFDIPCLHICTSVREVEKLVGSKVVLATDSSLSCGMAKELLLRWGGDPRCRVIFPDDVDVDSLAAELRSKTHPIVATITRPQRVELVGEELEAHQRKVEAKKRVREEADLRKRREEELSLLAAVRNSSGRDEDEDEEEEGGDGGGGKGKETDGPSSKRRKGSQQNKMARFAVPNFPMFQTKEIITSFDEYGGSISDLKFQDIGVGKVSRFLSGNAASIAAAKEAAAAASAVSQANATAASQASNAKIDTMIDDLENDEIVPWKLVAVSVRTQFTCSMREVALGGRADMKSIRTIISTVNPARLVVVRGFEKDCNEIVNYSRSSGIDSHAPKNKETVSFRVFAGRVRVDVPPKSLPSTRRSIRGLPPSALQGGKDVMCTVCTIHGNLHEVVDAPSSDGTRVVRLEAVTPADASTASVGAAGAAAIVDGEDEMVGDEDQQDIDEVVAAKSEEFMLSDLDSAAASGVSGLVSVGEVTFERLKKEIKRQLDQRDTTIDFRGGMLVVGGQVMVRKENENDFVIEGPPIPIFWEVKKALSTQFVWI